jgi:hypothetical protein
VTLCVVVVAVVLRYLGIIPDFDYFSIFF